MVIDMRVIKHGYKELQQECKRCGCVFEFDKKDVKIKTIRRSEDMGFILPNYKTVIYTLYNVYCPDCGKEIEIDCDIKY